MSLAFVDMHVLAQLSAWLLWQFCRFLAQAEMHNLVVHYSSGHLLAAMHLLLHSSMQAAFTRQSLVSTAWG